MLTALLKMGASGPGIEQKRGLLRAKTSWCQQLLGTLMQEPLPPPEEAVTEEKPSQKPDPTSLQR